MSQLQDNFEALRVKLLEVLTNKYPTGDIDIQYSQATALNGIGFVNGIDVRVEVNGEIDKYFIAEDQHGPYFQRYWNGRI